MNKLLINVRFQLYVDAEEGIDPKDIIQALRYNFQDHTGRAEIVYDALLDFEVKESTLDNHWKVS